MNRHIESGYKGRKPFQCNDCDVSFSQKWNLNWHIAAVHVKFMFKFCSISMNLPIYHFVFYISPSCWCLKYCVQVDEWKCHNFPRDELYNLLTVFMEFGFAKNSELTTSLGKCYIKTWCYKDFVMNGLGKTGLEFSKIDESSQTLFSLTLCFDSSILMRASCHLDRLSIVEIGVKYWIIYCCCYF